MVANYIPSKNKLDFEGFASKMWDQHGEVLGSNEDHLSHLHSTYLSKDPCGLGGRAVGIPGQTGSNNGGEKRGELIKEHWRRIVRLLDKELRMSG